MLVGDVRKCTFTVYNMYKYFLFVLLPYITNMSIHNIYICKEMREEPFLYVFYMILKATYVLLFFTVFIEQSHEFLKIRICMKSSLFLSSSWVSNPIRNQKLYIFALHSRKFPFPNSFPANSVGFLYGLPNSCTNMFLFASVLRCGNVSSEFRIF